MQASRPEQPLFILSIWLKPCLVPPPLSLSTSRLLPDRFQSQVWVFRHPGKAEGGQLGRGDYSVVLGLGPRSARPRPAVPAVRPACLVMMSGRVTRTGAGAVARAAQPAPAPPLGSRPAGPPSAEDAGCPLRPRLRPAPGRGDLGRRRWPGGLNALQAGGAGETVPGVLKGTAPGGAEGTAPRGAEGTVPHAVQGDQP